MRGCRRVIELVPSIRSRAFILVCAFPLVAFWLAPLLTLGGRLLVRSDSDDAVRLDLAYELCLEVSLEPELVLEGCQINEALDLESGVPNAVVCTNDSRVRGPLARWT